MKHPKLKPIFSMLLALVLCMGLAAPAFAANNTPTAPAQMAVKKTIQTPKDTPKQAETFAFTLTAVNNDAGVAPSAMPNITVPSITFTGGETYTAAAGMTNVETSSEHSTAFPVANSITWPDAGVYTYTLAETAGSTTNMTYATNTYTVQFVVAREPVTNVLYVENIIVPNGTGGKVTATPGASNVEFINTYAVTTGGGGVPTGPSDHSLSISKTVTGDLGSQTKTFPFEVTVTETGLSTATSHKAWVVNTTSNGLVTASTHAGTNVTFHAASGSTDAYLEITSGTTATIYLKHNETLAFTDLMGGTAYEAEELANPDYQAGVEVTIDGTAGYTDIASNVNTAVSTTTANGNTEVIIGTTGANKAEFTNDRSSTTATGVIIDNLPFILMLVVAAAGLVLFIVVKSRKRRGYASR